MRVLLIGATGLLGSALQQEWDGDELIGVGSRDADIRDESQVRQLLKRTRPEWTVLAAAYTDVDGCERDPQRAHDMNCVGAMNVARAARDARSKLLYVSTDYVFDGSKGAPCEPNDPVCPINVYGRSKADAEKDLREILPDCCILRTSWLFGANGRCFPNTILARAQSEKKLRVVADQIGRPTYNRDLARVIVRLVRAGAREILHAANEGACSWFDFACAVLRTAGLSDVTVEAVRTEDMPRPARRPKYSVLSTKNLEPYGLRMRYWQDTLADYFADRLKTSSVGQEVVSKAATAARLQAKPREVQ
jgi:dTDP-4-dehydrorhamnose reductase